MNNVQLNNLIGHLYFMLFTDECVGGKFNCSNGACISIDLVCNGINDCGDFSDELQVCGK